MLELKKNVDGSPNLNSVARIENYNKIQEQLNFYEESEEFELVSRTTVRGYISRKKLIINTLSDGCIEILIPAFVGSLFFEKRIYKPL